MGLVRREVPGHAGLLLRAHVHAPAARPDHQRGDEQQSAEPRALPQRSKVGKSPSKEVTVNTSRKAACALPDSQVLFAKTLDLASLSPFQVRGFARQRT